MRAESVQLSLIGGRDSNQDRVAVTEGEDVLLAIVADGMGGHAEGELAAEIAVETITDAFEEGPHPIVDPMGFLRLAFVEAHAEIVAAGRAHPPHVRPRATCAVCLVQEGEACWGHVGDSRVYLLREGKVLTRTRDHSHVELLRREGLISEQDMQKHPMRNYVEFCLGGDPEEPGMDIVPARALDTGDVLLVCSDGFWSGLADADIATLADVEPDRLEDRLRELAEKAVSACSPHSDNTTAAAIRWLGA